MLIVAHETHSTAVNEQPVSVGQRLSDDLRPGVKAVIDEMSTRVMSQRHAVLNYTSVVRGMAHDRQVVWTRQGDRIEIASYEVTATARVASVQDAVIKHEPRVLTIPTQDTK